MQKVNYFIFEPCVRTSLKIKSESPLSFIMTSGYVDGSYGYTPDVSACYDLEYMDGNYRYRGVRPPFRSPGADVISGIVNQVFIEYLK